MRTGSVDLLDVNVWLALGLPDHPHHARARRYWFDESATEVAFCRVTALAFTRLLTQPAVTGGEAMSVAEAWESYRNFRDLPEVVLATEPEGCEQLMEDWALGSGATRRLWTDAYLAAFAAAGAFRMVTFDRDFLRFERLETFLLSGRLSEPAD